MLMVNTHLHTGNYLSLKHQFLRHSFASDAKKACFQQNIELLMWKIDFMKICEVLDLDAILRSISLPFEKHVVFIAKSKHVRVKGSKLAYIDLSFSFHR